VSPEDARALSEARDLAHRLARTLDDLAPAVRPPVGPAAAAPHAAAGRRPAAVPHPETAPERRSRPALPVGMSADTRQGLEAMARAAGLVLVVDGYNVTQAAWPAVALSDQRQRLAQGLAGLTARFGCEAVVVFDGDGTVGLPALRRRGLRVIFSDAGEEADDVIVREVAALPKRVPVVVVSSDAWVREHAEAEGAVVVGAPTLLALLP
jgi:predicted RNA-binding protein with PIN domain